MNKPYRRINNTSSVNKNNNIQGFWLFLNPLLEFSYGLFLKGRSIRRVIYPLGKPMIPNLLKKYDLFGRY